LGLAPAVGCDSALRTARIVDAGGEAPSPLPGTGGSSGCDASPPFSCFGGVGEGEGCGDSGFYAVCSGGVWVCPAGSVPESECGCFGPPIACYFGVSKGACARADASPICGGGRWTCPPGTVFYSDCACMLEDDGAQGSEKPCPSNASDAGVLGTGGAVGYDGGAGGNGGTTTLGGTTGGTGGSTGQTGSTLPEHVDASGRCVRAMESGSTYCPANYADALKLQNPCGTACAGPVGDLLVYEDYCTPAHGCAYDADSKKLVGDQLMSDSPGFCGGKVSVSYGGQFPSDLTFASLDLDQNCPVK